MDLQFIILAFCLVGLVYSSFNVQNFLRTATGNWMKCPLNSYIVTNNSRHQYCNRERICHRISGNVDYLCVKDEFKWSNLTPNTIVDKDGFYLNEVQDKIELHFPKNSDKFFNLLLIRGNMKYRDMKTVRPFSTYSCWPRCKGGCRVIMYRDSRIVVKISSNRDEDFRNFLMDNNPKLTTKRKEKECYNGNGADYRGSISRPERGNTCMKWTQSTIINPSTHPNKGLGDHNYCRNPNNNLRPWCLLNQTHLDYCNISKCSYTTTAAATTTASTTTTTTATTMAHTIMWIILGAGAILLLIDFVLLAFLFYSEDHIVPACCFGADASDQRQLIRFENL